MRCGPLENLGNYGADVGSGRVGLRDLHPGSDVLKVSRDPLRVYDDSNSR